MREIILTAADANRRLDKYLAQYFNNVPRTLLYKMLRKKNIKLNGQKADGHEITQAGDCLTFYLSEDTINGWMSERAVEASAVLPDIVYEDDFMLMLNKPAGLLTHTGEDTLLRQVLYYLKQTGAYDNSPGATFTPALCNRLDRNTSGLVTCGKTLAALQVLNAIFAERRADKEYLAVARGKIDGSDILDGYLYKNEHTNKVYVSQNKEHADSVPIQTAYAVIAHGHGHTLLKIHPITGRSHQIRAQMAAIGHPLAGDVKYGGKKTPYAPAQLLHCCHLSFKETDGLPYAAGQFWQAPPPDGFTLCMKEWLNL